MAVTIQEIAAHLDAVGLGYKLYLYESDHFIVTGFRTRHYTDQGTGERAIGMAIQLFEDGEYIDIFAPLYEYPPDGPHLAAVLTVLLTVNFHQKLVKYGYDPRKGTVQVDVEWPVEDASVTKKQLLRAVFGLVQIVDRFDGAIRASMEGKIDRGLLERLSGAKPPDAEEPLDLEE